MIFDIFSELLLWAVLTKRQDMALLMWEHGEEALAKVYLIFINTYAFFLRTKGLYFFNITFYGIWLY